MFRRALRIFQVFFKQRRSMYSRQTHRRVECLLLRAGVSTDRELRVPRLPRGFRQQPAVPNPDTSNDTERKKLPSYPVFASDRARVVGGANLAQGQLDLANAFVTRAAFIARYPASQDGPTFVDAVVTTIQTDTGVNLTSQRTALINLFNSGGRSAVMYRLADDNLATNPINNRSFIDAEYNRAFVATQYFGYLRRDPDIGGFLFWLGQVNNGPLRDGTKQHGMVCSVHHVGRIPAAIQLGADTQQRGVFALIYGVLHPRSGSSSQRRARTLTEAGKIETISGGHSSILLNTYSKRA